MKQKTKSLRGHGSMNTSNVNSTKSQCITLTYTISNVKELKDIAVLETELPELVKQEDVKFDLIVEGHNSEEEKIILKAKVKTCDDEDRGHKIKEIFDKYLKKKGGQTTLDEDYVEEAS